ncbi:MULTISPECIES: phosphate ABC transporter permease PstA [Halobacteriovorax]|uniref:Phosphate transport system permease protein PstA n=1 Tax=Halobacteriovorax vibrionivorans TaxID=2152716 RepID=A0ABY0IH27_9BACT|nr:MULTISPECIES: phosphate ABC transporter permease PstA [Halobacteriovorax]AYF45133.1 phosphate ABC transporter, permease protein PstA [Halobacteriovorax sp. BALOs_7]RZF22229.1 phosphate ABC transporter permease PstA [Halobacteriovorax vibrionivorans]
MKLSKKRVIKNQLFRGTLILSSLIVIMPLILIFVFLLQKGSTSLSLDFFLNDPKPVGEVGGGMRHAIIGTLMMVALGSFIAVPVGTLCGVYLSEYGKGKIAQSLRFTIDLLTGVPSIVVGIFSYLIFVVSFKSFSALAGAFALSIIILPIVTRTTEEILKLIPRHVREAGLALGLPRWRVIWNIILRGSRNSLTTGVILAISRAAGETAPLLFTAFGSMYLSFQVTGPMASLPVQIYNYAISPYKDWQQQAWAGSFTLIIIVLGLNLSAKFLFNTKKLKKFFVRKS